MRRTRRRAWLSAASRRGLVLVTALALVAGLLLLTGPGGRAHAATPEYEITGTWVDAPESVSRGTPVVAEWHLNLNDADEPPANDTVDPVVVTFTLDMAMFDGIPDACRTDGVDPSSALTEDRRTLTCNLGSLDMGTALVIQTPVLPDGGTGDAISGEGTVGGRTATLPQIPIVNPFAMDILYGQNNEYTRWNTDATAVDLSLQWSLRLGQGSDPGPERVSYRIRVVDSNGRPVTRGSHPGTGAVGCTPYDGQGASDDHPYSHNPGSASSTRFVDSCTLTPVAGSPGWFDLVLDGIDYSLIDLPRLSGSGRDLPTDWHYVASGQLWFRVATTTNGSISLTSDAPTYTAPSGQQYTDRPANNTTTKTYRVPGAWSAAWERRATDSGGTYWDDTYRVPTGTTVVQFSQNRFYADGAPANSQYGACVALDARFVELASTEGIEVVSWDIVNPPVPRDDMTVEYYVGAGPLLDPASPQYDPNAFSCGASPGWVTSPPADLSTVRAVRIVYPFSKFAEADTEAFRISVPTIIKDTAPNGQDVWMFGSVMRNGQWIGAAVDSPVTPIRNARYPHTSPRRDVLRVISATPHITKAAAENSVTPGVPTEFTLTYSANGEGVVPATVDGYVIRDTLPVGMTYVPGSATPEPDVTVSPTGEQVLIWRLDGVQTNTEHTLTYQAVVEAGTPAGQRLVNTAVAEFDGTTSGPARATVITTTDGHTIIVKTADVAYIPNERGDGVGTGSWTVQIDSRDPVAQAFTDTIDILPYNGDGRGTAFHGSYELTEVDLLDGGTVYYTDADPRTLTDDPADPSNGAAGTIDGNTVGWTTTRPESPTAIRVIGAELAPGGSFAFRVVIATDGAEPQDVYVNRAQARAEHTALVMRTSAALVVTDYEVVKTSDPASGSVVRPGQTITYTVTVRQVGAVPAGAWLSDDLAAVLDDATYNGDVTADVGTAEITDTTLTWNGELPVGGVATITYSVTVKDVDGLRADGDTTMTNTVTSPGCRLPANCTTTHRTGYFTWDKTAEPAPGSVVGVGEKVTYRVTISQHGAAELDGVTVVDDLTAVLDDATFNDDASAPSGELRYQAPRLTWSGDLPVGATVVVTYSVTTTTGGDGELVNVATSDDDRGVCVPAADDNPDCRTTHELGDFEVVKTSDPATGTTVEIGDTITYTVTVRHLGKAAVPGAGLVDDLTKVLDDATWDGTATASAGTVTTTESTIRWSGDLAPGDVVTITYEVEVTAGGDRQLENVVTTDGRCVPAEGQTEACRTVHTTGGFVFSKTSDPRTGTTVRSGQTVTYTVTVGQVGSAAVEGASVVDDLSGVLSGARWNDDATASSGTLVKQGDQLRWTGDLAVGQQVTITYSVTVGDSVGSGVIRNAVTSDDDRGRCVAAADGNPDCRTEHPAVPGSGLAATGAPAGAAILIGLGGLLLSAGAAVTGWGLRRSGRRRGLIG